MPLVLSTNDSPTRVDDGSKRDESAETYDNSSKTLESV